MTSENNGCLLVQENIAWGRSLSNLDQDHVLSCSKCSAIAMELEEIDSVIKNVETLVPSGFAERVMKSVTALENPHVDFHLNFRSFFEVLFNNQVLRWGLGGTSFLLAFAAH